MGLAFPLEYRALELVEQKDTYIPPPFVDGMVAFLPRNSAD
jgi:hypothetical protein